MQTRWALLDIATLIVLGSGLYPWFRRGHSASASAPADASGKVAAVARATSWRGSRSASGSAGSGPRQAIGRVRLRTT